MCWVFFRCPKARCDERWGTDARDSFLDHFRWCKEAQRPWEASDEGKREITALPDAIRRGYFKKTGLNTDMYFIFVTLLPHCTHCGLEPFRHGLG